jgi:hypothetical protein
LAGPLVGQTPGRQLAQLVIDQGQQFLRGFRVTVLNRIKNGRQLPHRLIISHPIIEGSLNLDLIFIGRIRAPP